MAHPTNPAAFGGGRAIAPVLPGAGGLRIVRSRIEGATPLARSISGSAWGQSAGVLKCSMRTSVLTGPADVDGRTEQVVVKTVVLPGPGGFARSLLRHTRGHRQWRGARLLESAGVPCGAPLLLFTGTRPDVGHRIETLVLRHAPGRTLVQEVSALVGGRGSPGNESGTSGERAGIGTGDLARERALVNAYSELTMQLAAARLFNRDHKGSNMVVEWDEGEARLSLIDTGEVRRVRFSDELEMVTKTLVEAMGAGVMPRSVTRWRVLRALLEGDGPYDPAPMRAAWREVERRVARHVQREGSARPKDDPLG